MRTLAIPALALAVTACGDGPVPPDEKVVTTITVTPASATLDLDARTVQLTAVVKDQDGEEMPNVKVTWESPDTTVATVTEAGLVSGVFDGRIEVTASAEGVRGGSDIAVVYQRGALMAIYNGMGGGGWTNRTNWGSAEPLGEWYGVEEVDGRVVGLSLEENYVAGPIPPEIGVLRHLEALRLQRNLINGEFPVELGGMPALAVLHLNRNRLTGRVPEEIAAGTVLAHIEIQINRLEGPLPQDMTRMQLRVFKWYDQNGLCSPANDEFQDWLETIGVHEPGPECN